MGHDQFHFRPPLRRILKGPHCRVVIDKIRRHNVDIAVGTIQHIQIDILRQSMPGIRPIPIGHHIAALRYVPSLFL